jgi:hypothetical protein
MSEPDTDSLRDIATSMTEDGTIVEEQAESHSHEVVDEDAAAVAAAAAVDDGLEDAVDAEGAEAVLTG